MGAESDAGSSGDHVVIEKFADKVNTVMGRLLILLVAGYLGVVVLFGAFLAEQFAMMMLGIGVVSLVASVVMTAVLLLVLKFLKWFLFHGLD